MFLLLLLIVTFLNQACLNEAYDYSDGQGAAPAPAIPPLPFSTELSFPFFDNDSCTGPDGLLCTGGVTASNKGYLSLTPEPLPGVPNSLFNQNKVGRVLFKSPVVAWPAIISTTFTFRIITSPNSLGNGDGLTFVMAPDSSPSPPDSSGYYLGLMDKSTRDRRQLAVEFDTYKNYFDVDENHIAIDTTSVEVPLITRSLNDTGIDLKSGRDIKVRIDYNAWSKEFQISIGYASGPMVKFSPFIIDISNKVPNYVYVGFTASTGFFTESHQLLSWDFLTQYA